MLHLSLFSVYNLTTSNQLLGSPTNELPGWEQTLLSQKAEIQRILVANSDRQMSLSMTRAALRMYISLLHTRLLRPGKSPGVSESFKSFTQSFSSAIKLSGPADKYAFQKINMLSRPSRTKSAKQRVIERWHANLRVFPFLPEQIYLLSLGLPSHLLPELQPPIHSKLVQRHPDKVQIRISLRKQNILPVL